MVSLYSLQNLYNQGILDYVPEELASSPNVSSLNGMQNPYLNMVSQGSLYQNAGMTPDSFSYTGNINPQLNNELNPYMNSKNHFGSTNGNFGFNNPQIGMNTNGMYGNMSANNSQEKSNNLKEGFSKFETMVNNTPNLIKGLIAGGIVIGTTILCFKKGLKTFTKNPQPKPQSASFISKLKFWKK